QAEQTAIARRLAAWAAILAVPTAIAGIYGMNFEFMPELKWKYGYFLVMGLIVTVCVTLYWRFRRNDWLWPAAVFADARACASLQFIGPVAADHLEVAVGRPLEHALSVRPDRPVGECPMNAVERVTLERIHHAFDAGRR